MAELLSLRGRNALSPFRVAKLLSALAGDPRRRHRRLISGTSSSLAARAERRRARHARPHPDLRPAATADARRRRVAAGRAASGHDLAVVVEGDRHRAQLRPRRGQRASSAASPIASRTRDGAPLTRRSRRAAAADPRPDDRGRAARDLATRRSCSRTFAPRPLATIDFARRRPRARIEARTRRWASRCRAGRDRLPRRAASRARARSDRRRADDVRAGELRALPAQDLQRRLDRRRRARRTAVAVRDDPRTRTRRARRAPCVAYADNAAVIEGARRAALLSRRARRVSRARASRRTSLMKVETHNHPTAIAPFPGAATGSGGEIRDEGATGRGAQAESGPDRLHGVAPAHSRRCRSPGRATLRQAGSHRLGAANHARRPDRRRVVQQRIRPPEPARLLPHVRAGGRRAMRAAITSRS